MNTSLTIDDYLNELSSASPTPGGGNVAALCAVLACSLGIMVCNLTIGRKKYEEAEETLKSVKKSLGNFKEHFVKLSEDDNDAFNKVIDAVKLPRETEEEKKIRLARIEESTLTAANVPSEVIENCRKIIPFFEILISKGNKNSVSDTGVALSMLSSAAEGAFLNVLINCSSLSNKVVSNELLKKSEISYGEIRRTAGKLIDDIKRSLIKE